MEDLYAFEEEFRDTISTVDEQGKRVWVYPKKPKGKLHNKRIIVSIVLLGLLFAGPFIKISGRPLLLLNIFQRKFVILGQAFWPQDFYLFGLAMIIFVVFIILFTVIYGRVWCGWACPQTIFMEMVFRKIEYWIEGDANQQRKLDKAPWTRQKIFKKGLKHFIFLLIAILIAHTVMAYLIGVDQVKEIVQKPPTENLAGFIGLVAFTGVFYWVFAFFREQACVAVCPYGRLQGVLLGKDSIVVAYDWLRGEPRGKINKKKDVQEKQHGDCIDCKLCVHACPTGIDIRNGTQLECVNCTACIDACDEVMTKVNRPTGLIRFASDNQISEGTKPKFTARMVGYTIVLVILLGLFGTLLLSRSDVEATVMRVPGMLYQKRDDGKISNLYNIQLINKTFDTMDLHLQLEDYPNGIIQQIGGNDWKLKPNDKFDGVFFIALPDSVLHASSTPLHIKLMQGDKVIDEAKTNFLGPIKLEE